MIFEDLKRFRAIMKNDARFHGFKVKTITFGLDRKLIHYFCFTKRNKFYIFEATSLKSFIAFINRYPNPFLMKKKKLHLKKEKLYLHLLMLCSSTKRINKILEEYKKFGYDVIYHNISNIEKRDNVRVPRKKGRKRKNTEQPEHS